MTELNLFQCSRLRAELTARGCLVNQAMGRAEGERSRYWPCVECETRRVLRETTWLEPPKVVRHYGGGWWMPEAGPNKEMGHAGTPGEKEMGKPRLPKGKIKMCKNHPEREALPGGAMCIECKRAYQREWLQKKKAAAGGQEENNLTPRRRGAEEEDMKGKPIMTASGDVVRLPSGKPLLVGGEAEAEKILEAVSTLPEEPSQDKEVKLCSVCKERPRHKTSNRCLECLQAQISDPAFKGKRLAGIKRRSQEAWAVLRKMEAGELIEAAQRYEEIFVFVPELFEWLESRAKDNFRSVAAEMAIILREAMKGGQ